MITIVVGAQYGGEGKGKVSAFLSHREKVEIACRCGGPNSSHTIVHAGRSFRLRMMPATAVIDTKVDVYFGAGTLIHISTLMKEIEDIGFKGRVFIDRNAGIVTDEIVASQRSDMRYATIGSTMTGTGLASALRAQRKLKLASDYPELTKYVCDLQGRLSLDIQENRRILIEGHQGYGLSNYHGDYPFTSSRDSTAAEMLSELGLGPVQKRNALRVVLVVKIFPTRNHAGNLGDEVQIEDAEALGITEYGGGSWGIPDQRRRVGIFDGNLVRRAVFANSASEIALTGADYLDHTLRGARSVNDSVALVSFIKDFKKLVPGCPVKYVSTGPETRDMIELGTKAAVLKSKEDSRYGDLFS